MAKKWWLSREARINRGAVVMFTSEARYAELGVVFERILHLPGWQSPMAQVIVEDNVIWVPTKYLERIDYDGDLVYELSCEYTQYIHKQSFQVNLHFGERQVSACNLSIGTVIGRGVGDCVRRIVRQFHVPAQLIELTFQPED